MKLRERILQALRQGGEHSGEALAAELGVSRNAVWKAVEQLRREGYPIQAATNRGYRLDLGHDPLSEEILREAVGGDRTAVFLPETDSTNADARRLADEGAPSGTVVVAMRQTAGRGRLGRSFASGEGGLYMSMILRPRQAAVNVACLTAYAAVAAAEALEELAPSAGEIGIKWVNDLFRGGRKLAGILCEGMLSMEDVGFRYVVVGIGINLRRAAIPNELRGIATALDEYTDAPVSRAALAAAIARRMDRAEEALHSCDFLDSYRRRSVILGREVLVSVGEERYSAVAESIDDSGALTVRTPSGECRRLVAGEVSVRDAALVSSANAQCIMES